MVYSKGAFNEVQEAYEGAKPMSDGDILRNLAKRKSPLQQAEEKIALTKSMADRLISTLDVSMPSATADLIVRTVAMELYHLVLGIDGKIVQKTSGIAHGSWGKNGKKTAIQIATYEFKEIKQ